MKEIKCLNLNLFFLYNFFLMMPAFLIPYMAIRLNDADDESVTRKLSQFGSVMTNGAPIVGVIGGSACIVSLLWALFGRMDANFGGIADRWDYLVGYLGSERLAYAFIWDICLYIIFQPWLIGDNLQNVQENKVFVVKYLRYNKIGDSLCCFPFCCCQVASIYLLFAICSDKFLFIYINGWPYCLCFFILFKYYYCTLISPFAFADNPRLSNIGYLDFGG